MGKDYRLGRVLLRGHQIQNMVHRISGEILRDYTEPPLMVGLLKGAEPFCRDIRTYVKAMGMDPELRMITASSYSGTKSSGKVDVDYDALGDIRGREVLLTDDILDTGRTPSAVMSILEKRGAKNIRTCFLLKRKEQKVQVRVDYLGMELPGDEFVVGYGMDCNEKWRNEPCIHVVEEIG